MNKNDAPSPTAPPDAAPACAAGGLRHALILNGKGGARQMTPAQLDKWTPAKGTLWLHFDLGAADTADWLASKSRLDPVIVDTILEENTPRPRCTQFGDGLLVVLRAVNANPGLEPDDMVYLHIWVEAKRIITFRRQPMVGIRYIRRNLNYGVGPSSAASMLDEICSTVTDRIHDTVMNLEDILDDVEDDLVNARLTDGLMGTISETRRQLSTIRRYLAPQRDIMDSIGRQTVPWLDKKARFQLKEIAARLFRSLEDIDNLWERCSINIDEINSKRNEQTKRNMYMISMLATFFLPLTFVTGLLGANVGGIPLSDYEHGFAVVTATIVAMGAAMLVWFKKMKWL
ncbi:zinc transport protein ZntB [Alphaproteobacteria bacterium]|nr:zinc transport protein ZntB [Alphaproteobacteria bacterium]